MYESLGILKLSSSVDFLKQALPIRIQIANEKRELPCKQARKRLKPIIANFLDLSLNEVGTLCRMYVLRDHMSALSFDVNYT